ncbi:autoinducer binding domain-containing protein [Yunchengibacter salinarum]|uniref:autoinducer binding domain-containing protein n=1 Tax=Yunchengibacter salinarum TaxID=3133399 RepID=UPI0035B646B6
MADHDELEKRVLAFVEALGEIDDIATLTALFSALIRDYGYENFRCAELYRSGAPLYPRLAFGELSHDWCVYYRENDYVYADVTVQQGLIAKYPFTWSDIRERQRINALSERMFREAERDFHLKDGLLVPIHQSDGTVSMVSMIGEAPDTADIVRRALGMAAQFLHNKARELSGFRPEDGDFSGGSPVSRRQLDCLQWVAEGKSDWEISQILGIAEATVHNHIEAAKRSLSVTTRAQAVATASRRKLMIL